MNANLTARQMWNMACTNVAAIIAKRDEIKERAACLARMAARGGNVERHLREVAEEQAYVNKLCAYMEIAA